MTKNNYNIVIADDHKLIISGISHIIANNTLGNVIAELNNGNQLLDFLENSATDLVILDINMPELNGIQTAEILVKKYPNISILMVSQHENIELIKKLQKLGVKGYLSKNFEISQLILAIKTIQDKKEFFPMLLNDFSIITKEKFILTTREIEIISLISIGYSSKQIANKLFLSQYTIETHRKNCMRKLDVNTSQSLVNVAKDLGYML